MTENKDRMRAFMVSQDTLQETPDEPVVDILSPTLTAETDVTLADTEQDDQPESRITLRSKIGLAAATAYLVLNGSSEATASSADTLAQQAPSQGSDTLTQYGPLALTALGLVATVAISGRTMARQSRENRENRFNTALQSLKGESSGEERVLRLATLNTYARTKEFAPSVFEFAATYLRGRRSGLDIIRKDHEEDSAEFEAGVAERRNADREALKLLLKTLPAARNALLDSGPSRVKRWIGADKQYELDKLTGVEIPDEKSRVNTRGINIDFMRDVKRYNFSDMDLTGAGMRKNQFSSVIFTNSRLSEVQFEGSRLNFCDLRATDARAAHWDGAEINACVINKRTELGNLPDSHPDARKGVSIDPNNPNAYRGNPRVVLKDLIPDKGMAQEELVEKVHEWQRNGLILLTGSNPEYLLPNREFEESEEAA